MKRLLKKIVPTFVFSLYHFLLSLAGAVFYGFPSRKIYCIGVTGTKGKTSTTEIVNAILEEAGLKTALLSTLRFKIDSDSNRNLLKMTMPGRFFIQKSLAQAVKQGCTHAIIEMTSEGTKQFRHKFIALDALLVTNLSPEHIESHGSYEKYKQAKLKIARALEKSSKPNKILITNGDDSELEAFRQTKNVKQLAVHLSDGAPSALMVDGLFFTYQGLKIQTHLLGQFNLANILLASSLASSLNIKANIVKQALEKFTTIPGRVEKIFPTDTDLAKLQDFTVIVDYAHTADSLTKLYEVYRDHKIIAVLGGTGGGRDKWKRPVMGGVADKYASFIFITDEDPYDEDPKEIMDQVASGIKHNPYKIIPDRRLAIREALAKTSPKSVILITGKGTDPYIMRASGTKEPWSDSEVAREELTKFLETK